MRSDISILRSRSFRLRNLSLFHCANAWSIMHRGYAMSYSEFYGDHLWLGWKNLSFDHVLKPKPRLKFHRFVSIIKGDYVQLSLDL